MEFGGKYVLSECITISALIPQDMFVRVPLLPDDNTLDNNGSYMNCFTPAERRLTRCCFSLGIIFFRMRSWCSWKRISFGKPGTKKPTGEDRTRRNVRIFKPTDEYRNSTGLFSQLVPLLGCVTVHGVLLSRQQFDQSPEGILFVHVDEQQGCDLTHPLAVSNLLQTNSQGSVGSYHTGTLMVL